MEIVSFELAKKLKEKGFDKYCCRAYNEIGCFNDTDTYKDSEEFYCYAPQISQVLKWFREEKKMYIEIFLYNGAYSYFVKSITKICEDDWFHQCLNEDIADLKYVSYEQAAIAGVEYVIDNLI